MSVPFFDLIVVADWSANATPKSGQDSIWIAALDPAADELALTNPSTRRDALDELGRLAEPGRRMLLGVDFSLGYPAGTAASLGMTGSAWRAMWRHLGAAVVDDERNRNNRFDVARRLNEAIGGGPGPFWGCPPSSATTALTSTKPGRVATWPGEWRVVESAMRSAGLRPFSAWQLLGAGAVGGQSLVGIAALERLRWNLGQRVAVWPFTTGLDLPDDESIDVVVAEVWPSLWDVTVPPGVVKDAAQVESTARRLADLDATGELAEMFRVELEPAEACTVCAEEGWVLGVGRGRS